MAIAKTRKKRAKSGAKKIVVIGKTRKKRRSTGVARTHHKPRKKAVSKPRKKRGVMGSTGGRGTSLKKIAWMAVGVGTGAVIDHVIIRPIAARLVAKWPAIGKWVGVGEIFLGGLVALKGKREFTKAVGVGIMAGGVHTVLKQVNIYKHIPALGALDEYTTIQVPISGPRAQILSGLLQDRHKQVKTYTVAGSIGALDETRVIASSDYGTGRYGMIAGDWDDAFDAPMAKGFN